MNDTIVILGMIMITIIICVGVRCVGRCIQGLSLKAFEELAEEMRADNAILKTELASVRADLDSINKMMREIQ